MRVLKHGIVATAALILSACGVNNNSASLYQSKTVEQTDDFALFCTAKDPAQRATLQALRLYKNGDAVDMAVDQYGQTQWLNARDAQVAPSATGESVNVAWNNGTKLVATKVHGRNFEGILSQADGKIVALGCIKIDRADRDPGEWSMACALKDAAQSVAQAAPHDLLLTYEEGELELFANASAKEEVFDLELTHDLSVSAKAVHGTWPTHNTVFSGVSTDGEAFDAMLTYHGTPGFQYQCWKI